MSHKQALGSLRTIIYSATEYLGSCSLEMRRRVLLAVFDQHGRYRSNDLRQVKRAHESGFRDMHPNQSVLKGEAMSP